MFWADRIVEEVISRYGAKNVPIVIRDEKTASGRVHIGSLRSASLHAAVAEGLAEKGIPYTFFFEINDFDPMDGLPNYLDEAEYEKFLGLPLYKVPSPDPSAPNFAEYYGGEYVDVMRHVGFIPEVYRASELYLSGRMNDAIKTALEKRDIIRTIYKEESGGERPETWYPLNVMCEQCGKVSTTVVTGFDGERVSYTCRENAVDWTVGCGHEGIVSPFDGNAKLPWKVEWAAKFKVVGVHFEGAGKDHYTKGGARQVADRIARDAFECEPPYGVANEFFLVGGEKMSSSKGKGASAREIADLIPPHILRLALFRSDIGRQINFNPEGDTIPVLFDHYDKIAEKYWSGSEDDDARVFVKCHIPGDTTLLNKRFLPRFSQIAFLVQMTYLSLEREVETLKGEALTEDDYAEMNLRAEYARRWLSTSAPDDFRFELQNELPESARDITTKQKVALKALTEKLSALSSWEGQAIHTALHESREASGLEPADFFAPLYLAFLGKKSGPKAGWFLSTLEKDFVLDRLSAAAS